MIITKIYIKIHQITGHPYLGKTIKDPVKHGGNGKRYENHARVHGDLWDTYIVGEYDETQQEELKRDALDLSEKHDIVDSNWWLNLIPENGIDGGDTRSGMKHTEEAKRKNSEAHIGWGRDYIITDLKGREHFVRSPTEFAKRYFPDNWKNVRQSIMHTASGRQKTFCAGYKAEVA